MGVVGRTYIRLNREKVKLKLKQQFKDYSSKDIRLIIDLLKEIVKERR